MRRYGVGGHETFLVLSDLPDFALVQAGFFFGGGEADGVVLRGDSRGKEGTGRMSLKTLRRERSAMRRRRASRSLRKARTWESKLGWRWERITPVDGFSMIFSQFTAMVVREDS